MVKGLDRDAEAEAALLRRVLDNIARVLGHDLTDSAPPNERTMRFRFPPAGADREARGLARGRPVWKKKAWVLGTALGQALCERFDRKAGDYDAPKCRAELRTNTDFRKFDGVPHTVLDVTASRQAEEALRERNRALEEADAVMTRFLANMSYEFRTPLTSIGGFAELLTSGVAGELTPQARDYAEAISLSVGKLTEQVENVLDLSQSEAGLMPLSKQKLDLLPLITQVVRKREGAIVDAGLTLDLRGDPGKKVEADPQQIRRAIAHLLDNAIAATARDGKIMVELRQNKAGTKITLSDNGRGMTQHELARALEGIRPTRDGKGIERRQGLGIPLARHLIEAAQWSAEGAAQLHFDQQQREGPAAATAAAAAAGTKRPFGSPREAAAAAAAGAPDAALAEARGERASKAAALAGPPPVFRFGSSSSSAPAAATFSASVLGAFLPVLRSRLNGEGER